MPQSTKPSVAYSKLLHLIQTLQSQMDQIPAPPGLQARLIPASILNLCAAEAMLLDIEQHEDWEENYNSLWHSLISNNGMVLDRLITLSENFHLKISMIHYLPPSGSQEWWALYTFVRLMSECSHIIQAKPDSEEVEEKDCAICYESFQVSERYIQLTCHHSHWFHEKCLTQMASGTLYLFCPLCRRVPFS